MNCELSFTTYELQARSIEDYVVTIKKKLASTIIDSI